MAATGQDRILQYSPAGSLLLSIGNTGSGAGQFKVPKGFTVEPGWPVTKSFKVTAQRKSKGNVKIFAYAGGKKGQVETEVDQALSVAPGIDREVSDADLPPRY